MKFHWKGLQRKWFKNSGKESTMNKSHMTKSKVALGHPRHHLIWFLYRSSKNNMCKIGDITEETKAQEKIHYKQ